MNTQVINRLDLLHTRGIRGVSLPAAISITGAANITTFNVRPINFLLPNSSFRSDRGGPKSLVPQGLQTHVTAPQANTTLPISNRFSNRGCWIKARRLTITIIGHTPGLLGGVNNGRYAETFYRVPVASIADQGLDLVPNPVVSAKAAAPGPTMPLPTWYMFGGDTFAMSWVFDISNINDGEEASFLGLNDTVFSMACRMETALSVPLICDYAQVDVVVDGEIQYFGNSTVPAIPYWNKLIPNTAIIFDFKDIFAPPRLTILDQWGIKVRSIFRFDRNNLYDIFLLVKIPQWASSEGFAPILIAYIPSSRRIVNKSLVDVNLRPSLLHPDQPDPEIVVIPPAGSAFIAAPGITSQWGILLTGQSDTEGYSKSPVVSWGSDEVFELGHLLDNRYVYDYVQGAGTAPVNHETVMGNHFMVGNDPQHYMLVRTFSLVDDPRFALRLNPADGTVSHDTNIEIWAGTIDKQPT